MPQALRQVLGLDRYDCGGHRCLRRCRAARLERGQGQRSLRWVGVRLAEKRREEGEVTQAHGRCAEPCQETTQCVVVVSADDWAARERKEAAFSSCGVTRVEHHAGPLTHAAQRGRNEVLPGVHERCQQELRGALALTPVASLHLSLHSRCPGRLSPAASHPRPGRPSAQVRRLAGSPGRTRRSGAWRLYPGPRTTAPAGAGTRSCGA